MSFSLLDTAGLERGLDACSLRNKVIANNIANAHTPGYVGQTVLFDQYMRDVARARSKSKDGSPDASLLQEGPQIAYKSGKVDIVTEMASLAKNQILYNTYATRVSNMFLDLEWIIENAGR